MEESSPVAVLLSWFPMLLLIAVWMIAMVKYGVNKNTYRKMFEEQVRMTEEMQRQNEILERIAVSMERR